MAKESRKNRTNIDIILLFLAKPLDKHGITLVRTTIIHHCQIYLVILTNFEVNIAFSHLLQLKKGGVYNHALRMVHTVLFVWYDFLKGVVCFSLNQPPHACFSPNAKKPLSVMLLKIRMMIHVLLIVVLYFDSKTGTVTGTSEPGEGWGFGPPVFAKFLQNLPFSPQIWSILCLQSPHFSVSPRTLKFTPTSLSYRSTFGSSLQGMLSRKEDNVVTTCE